MSIPSMVRQINRALDAIMALGQSRREGKRDGGAMERIYSYGTRTTYQDQLIPWAKWCRVNCGAGYLTQITPDMTRRYLDTKKDEWTFSQFKTFRSALVKLEKAVDARWGERVSYLERDYRWHGRPKNGPEEQRIRPYTPEGGRELVQAAYSKLSESRSSKATEITKAFEVIRETGLRVDDKVKSVDWESRVITVQGKGGKERYVTLVDQKWFDTKFRQYFNEAREKGLVAAGKLGKLWDVSTRTLQRWEQRLRGQVRSGSGSGCHGLRGSWAQEKYRDLINSGWSTYSAKWEMTRQLGHNRLDVLKEYGIL